LPVGITSLALFTAPQATGLSAPVGEREEVQIDPRPDPLGGIVSTVTFLGDC